MFRRSVKHLVLLSSAVWLMSCAFIPTYKLSENQNYSRVNLKELSNAWVCVNKKKYGLKKEDDGYAKVPSDVRLTIGSIHSWSGYNITYSCEPSVSFVPVGGQKYYINWAIREERCYVEVYREGAQNRVGLDIVDTISGYRC